MKAALRRSTNVLTGDVSGLTGDVSGLLGDVTGLWGNATGLRGDLAACGLSDSDRAAGVKIETLVGDA